MRIPRVPIDPGTTVVSERGCDRYDHVVVVCDMLATTIRPWCLREDACAGDHPCENLNSVLGRPGFRSIPLAYYPPWNPSVVRLDYHSLHE